MKLLNLSAAGLMSHTLLLEQAKISRRQKAIRQLNSSSDRRSGISGCLAELKQPTLTKSSYSERLLQFTDR